MAQPTLCVDCSGIKSDIISLNKTDEAQWKEISKLRDEIKGLRNIMIATMASGIIAALTAVCTCLIVIARGVGVSP